EGWDLLADGCTLGQVPHVDPAVAGLSELVLTRPGLRTHPVGGMAERGRLRDQLALRQTLGLAVVVAVVAAPEQLDQAEDHQRGHHDDRQADANCSRFHFPDLWRRPAYVPCRPATQNCRQAPPTPRTLLDQSGSGCNLLTGFGDAMS